MSNQSDTPRTDEQNFTMCDSTGGSLVSVEFARQLERELNEAIALKRAYELSMADHFASHVISAFVQAEVRGLNVPECEEMMAAFNETHYWDEWADISFAVAEAMMRTRSMHL